MPKTQFVKLSPAQRLPLEEMLHAFPLGASLIHYPDGNWQVFYRPGPDRRTHVCVARDLAEGLAQALHAMNHRAGAPPNLWMLDGATPSEGPPLQGWTPMERPPLDALIQRLAPLEVHFARRGLNHWSGFFYRCTPAVHHGENFPDLLAGALATLNFPASEAQVSA